MVLVFEHRLLSVLYFSEPTVISSRAVIIIVVSNVLGFSVFLSQVSGVSDVKLRFGNDAGLLGASVLGCIFPPCFLLI